MVDQEQLRVWAARLAAPVAFFLAATVLILLVQSGLSAGDESGNATPTTTVPTGTGSTGNSPTTTGQQPKPKKRFYRVRSGDTLESIAARFETDVETLLQFNPAIEDPLALQPGERIRIR
ncbi:MAG: LysM peptidoglycan-binding domain-containing protein [Gaiellaceae bacterium]